MTHVRLGLALTMTAAITLPLYGQPSDALTAAQMALACAPGAPADTPLATAPRVLGAQDTLPHVLLGPQDLLVIQGGTQAGLHLGQQFFVRRASAAYARRSAGPYATMGRSPGSAATTTTAGWLRLVALNESRSIARVDYACGAIFAGDYLEPFEAPSVPPDAERDDSTGELDFMSMSRVVSGPENHLTAAAGEYVIIDRGADQGIAPGGRLAIYRDLRNPGMPLIALGEAVVMTAGKNTAVIRINRARDAVFVGDYLVSRK
jgi:hypothetical protein